MINNVRNYGYDATRVVDLIFNLESLEQERVEKDSQIRKMRNSEDTLKASLQQLEQALSAQQAKLESLEKVRRLGFDFRELELIHHITNKIAKHQGTDPASSKNRLFHDIEQYYNDEDDFRKRLHDTEVLLHDRQKELDTLQKNYQDKKDVIDLLERLSDHK
jgi:chromosome segregation ATPase